MWVGCEPPSKRESKRNAGGSRENYNGLGSCWGRRVCNPATGVQAIALDCEDEEEEGVRESKGHNEVHDPRQEVPPACASTQASMSTRWLREALGEVSGKERS
jgi:hypothetical protein